MASPAAVIAPREEAEWREDILSNLFVVLNGLVATKLMAAGWSRSSPGAAGRGKMRTASTGRFWVPKRIPLASPQTYLPWKARPAGGAGNLRKMVHETIVYGDASPAGRASGDGANAELFEDQFVTPAIAQPGRPRRVFIHKASKVYEHHAAPQVC